MESQIWNSIYMDNKQNKFRETKLCINCGQMLHRPPSLRAFANNSSGNRFKLCLELDSWNLSGYFVSLLLILCICIDGLHAATTESSVDSDTTEATSVEKNDKIPSDAVIPKAVVTVAGIFAFVLLGLGISKLVDYCYDRHAISDDASDISDYTKELLRAQLMLAFSKSPKNKKLSPDELAKKYVKVWRAKAARNKVRVMKKEREMAEKSGTFRPSSARVKTAGRNRPSVSVNTVNEKNTGNRPRSSKVGAVTRKGTSRPISAGLKSRPSTANSAHSFKFVPRAGKRS